MPGIVGIISRQSTDECQRLVRAMIDCMQYETFYASGTCFVPEIGVYGGWVAHEGSFAVRQSASSAHNDVTLLFSGECFRSFHSSGQSASTEQQGNSDLNSDQLARLYEKESDSFVTQLNGFFSVFLIDRQRKRALLFNDRYGLERIYYYEKGGTIFFASEAKALLRVIPELRSFDDEGVAQFLAFGCTLNGRTLFRNMRSLPGGSLWIFDGNVLGRKERYFRPEEWESQPILSEEAFELEFIETFRRILPRYVSSDSSIGISLTGGLDTRMIMACLPQSAVQPVCYTFSGLTGRTLDARLAARVAEICGLEHHVLRIGMDFLKNYGHYVDRTVFITDGCAGALGAHEIYFNAQARMLSQIRLTGNFGSEILRNVSTFKPLSLSSKLINTDFKGMLNSLILNVFGNKAHPVTFAAFEEIPWNLFGTLAAGRSQLIFRTPYLDNEIVALAYRAPVSSRQSPRSALRLTNQSNPNLGSIPTDRGLVWQGSGPSYRMRRLFSEFTFKLDYLHKEGLSHWLSPFDSIISSFLKFGLFDSHKFLAYRIWFRRDLAAYINDILNDEHTQRVPYWNSLFLSSIVNDHIRGRKNYIREIHAVLTLEAVERLLIRGSSEASEGAGNVA